MVLSTLLNVVLLAAESGTKLVNVEDLLDKLLNWSIDAGKSILAALIIFIIGRFVIKQINRLFRKILERRKLEVSVRTFLESLVSLLLNIVLAFAVISKLGVETTSLAALLASAGVAIGMALSGNLSNFAGGLIILVFKPFKVGDYIDGPDDESGTVKEIQIFHTVLTTVDNRIIYVPNGLLSSNAITNYSKQETRRAEWVFGVEYGEDFERVKEVLQRIIDNISKHAHKPAPVCFYPDLFLRHPDLQMDILFHQRSIHAGNAVLQYLAKQHLFFLAVLAGSCYHRIGK